MNSPSERNAWSASSWGCELKLFPPYLHVCTGLGQPLREAVSWNNYMAMAGWKPQQVSLFVRLWVEILTEIAKMRRLLCQPLREAVSWNTKQYMLYQMKNSQPLREAVSWNISRLNTDNSLPSSASSWGCELKYDKWYIDISCTFVSLFVRLWVEINLQWSIIQILYVSLFVRLWVEITWTRSEMP